MIYGLRQLVKRKNVINKSVIIDIETNRLEDPDVIHCIVCKELETGNVEMFAGERLHEDFREYSSSIDMFIGHNALNFDIPILNALSLSHFNQCISLSKVLDTLVISRLFNFAQKDGHSLEVWGEKLGQPKLHTNISFDTYSPELLERCIRDVEINHKLYLKLEPHIKNPLWKDSILSEHKMNIICSELHKNGFPIDKTLMEKTFKEVLEHLRKLDSIILSSFKPKLKLIKEITPKLTKHGTLSKNDFRWYLKDSKDKNLSIFSEGHPFSLFDIIPFNPRSHDQLVEVLNEAGWNPYEKTDAHSEVDNNNRIRQNNNRNMGTLDKQLSKDKIDHLRIYGWKVSENNLATLPDSAPEATRMLVERFLVEKRRSTLEEYLNASTPHPEVSNQYSIHGTFNHIGTWSGRMSHSNPNLGNPPSIYSKYNSQNLKDIADHYGREIRKCFIAPEGYKLIGVDADGIQARIFAHYINDAGFIERLVNGRSEDGTDIHSYHWKQFQPACKSRADAKTFFYAWLLGAGVAKIASIFGCSQKQAREVRKLIVDIYPGLEYLITKVIPKDAAKGYIKGLDGRLVKVPDERRVLAAYLQNGEAVIMKHASIQWFDQLPEMMIPFKFVNFVHDEWETIVSNDPEIIKIVSDIQVKSIEDMGIKFKLNCPLKGNAKVGNNWLDVH